MKKILLSIFSGALMFSTGLLYGQTFNTASDTVRRTYSGPGVNTYNNNISVPGSSSVKVSYHVIDSDFPATWLTSSAFGICDNFLCRYNTNDTALWNASTHSGPVISATYNPGFAQTFDLSMDLSGTGVASGTHYMTMMLMDSSTTPMYTKTVTFIISRIPAAVQNVNQGDESVKLYPNPASDEINLVYNQGADVKNAAIYNIIGKMMNVYKVTDNTSANLKIDNLPSGIYFVKLYNSAGSVVVTRKFTKQ